VTMTAAERKQATESWRTSMAGYLERRTGPRSTANWSCQHQNLSLSLK
jgi:hypothetical protein